MTSKVQDKSEDKSQDKDELAALKVDYDHLREDVAELASSFKAFLEAQKTRVTPQQGEAGEAAGSAGEEEGETEWQEFRRKLDEARLHSEQAIDDLGQEVVQHPLASLAVAFGVGYLAAKLLK